MSIGVSDANGYRLGSIDGDAIYDANGQKAGAVVNGNKIWDAYQHEVGAVVNGNEIWDAYQHKVGAVVNGNQIWDANQHKLGQVNGNASTIQMGAAGGLLVLGLAAQKTNYTPSGGESFNPPSRGKDGDRNPLWVFITNPIGNIILGLLIAIGLTIFLGGVSMSGGYPLGLGIIITVIGVFRLFWRWKKRK
jgi:hypothetical protein